MHCVFPKVRVAIDRRPRTAQNVATPVIPIRIPGCFDTLVRKWCELWLQTVAAKKLWTDNDITLISVYEETPILWEVSSSSYWNTMGKKPDIVQSVTMKFNTYALEISQN